VRHFVIIPLTGHADHSVLFDDSHWVFLSMVERVPWELSPMSGCVFVNCTLLPGGCFLSTVLMSIW